MYYIHTLGSYIKEKRVSKQISLRKFAEMLNISPVYLSNIENERTPSPKDDIISNIAKLLNLNETETTFLYDLAAKAKANPTISQDLPE